MANQNEELRRVHRQIGKLMTLASTQEERDKLKEPFRLAEKALTLGALDQLDADDVLDSMTDELKAKNEQIQAVIDNLDSVIAIAGLVTETARLALSLAVLAARV